MDALELLKQLPDNYVNCVITSPPYYALRDYGVEGQIGLEETPAAFIARLVAVFDEVRRVLRDDGVCWVNMGDSYANDEKWGGSTGGKHSKGLHGETSIGRTKTNTGLPPKSRLGMPHRLVFALQDAGWIWRDEIIWHKPNPMPESVTDRTTKAHEYVFMLTKRGRYWYDAAAIREESIGDCGNRNAFRGAGAYTSSRTFDNSIQCENLIKGNTGVRAESRNKRSVWTIPTEPTPFAHFATFPQALIEPLILAGCPKGGLVFDPFMGSGTTAIVARRLNRNFIGSELNPEYAALANDRLAKDDTVLQVELKTGIEQLTLFGAVTMDMFEAFHVEVGA
jgi:DNA modification methylase